MSVSSVKSRSIETERNVSTRETLSQNEAKSEINTANFPQNDSFERSSQNEAKAVGFFAPDQQAKTLNPPGGE
jgi:hypothetical protein